MTTLRTLAWLIGVEKNRCQRILALFYEGKKNFVPQDKKHKLKRNFYIFFLDYKTYGNVRKRRQKKITELIMVGK